jgi:hypothetical protein
LHPSKALAPAQVSLLPGNRHAVSHATVTGNREPTDSW